MNPKPLSIRIDKERRTTPKAIKPEKNSTRRFVSRWSQCLRPSVLTRSSYWQFFASSAFLHLFPGPIFMSFNTNTWYAWTTYFLKGLANYTKYDLNKAYNRHLVNHHHHHSTQVHENQNNQQLPWQQGSMDHTTKVKNLIRVCLL